MVILDTNILIDHFRRPNNSESYLYKIADTLLKDKLGISIITIQELFEGKSSRNKKQIQLVLGTIATLKIVSYTFNIAKLAGELARDLGKAIDFPDAAIAATAIVNQAELFTLNGKDYRGIKNLNLYNLDSLESGETIKLKRIPFKKKKNQNN